MGKPKVLIIARVTTESVHKHTKKHWDEWIRILDKAGAKNWLHSETAKFLKQKYKLTPWWQHGVAMGYEYHHNKRVEGRNAKGDYTVSVTKSLPVSATQVWKFLTSEAGQNIWLKPLTPLDTFAPKVQFEVEGGIYGEIRTLKAPERLRLRWQDTEWIKPSIVNIGVVAKTNGKSILYITHDSLPSNRLREEMRQYWRDALVTVHAILSADT